MDKEHLIDLISHSMLNEFANLDFKNKNYNTEQYLNTLDLNQLRIISKEFLL